MPSSRAQDYVLRVGCFNEIRWNYAHHHPPHSASKVAGESTLTIHLGSDESKCDKHL